MRRLLPLVTALILAACTFAPDLGDEYFPCKPDGTCPGECECLEGQVCVPPENKDINDCAWCEDDQVLCREGKKVWCARLNSDPENCGSCSNICQLPNATTDCDNGTCVIFECLDTYEDCDQLDYNGCEACLETDPYNCGECWLACHYPPPPTCDGDELTFYLDTGDCVSSECQYQSSTKPCDHGCENGACKDDPCTQITCNLNQHCDDGLCVCDDLYGDCDTNNLNGCETYLNTVENCGECEWYCGKDSICVDGACDCMYGFGNCNDNRDDGCETDVLYEERHCGTCNYDCEAGLTCCLGSCVDLTADDQNCGECNNACALNTPCQQSACGAQGISCRGTICDFVQEKCCYGVNGLACYPNNSCTARIVECDDDEDCGDFLYCCLIDGSQHITQCTSSCSIQVCSSDEYCRQHDPDNPHCCSGDFDGQPVNLCQSEICQ